MAQNECTIVHSFGFGAVVCDFGRNHLEKNIETGMGPNWMVSCVGYVGFAHTMLRWPLATGVSKGPKNGNECTIVHSFHRAHIVRSIILFPALAPWFHHDTTQDHQEHNLIHFFHEKVHRVPITPYRMGVNDSWLTSDSTLPYLFIGRSGCRGPFWIIPSMPSM